MNKRPFFVVCIFFIFGILLARFLPAPVRFPHIFIVTLILIAFTLALASLGRGNIFLLLSIISFAALLYVNSNIFPSNHISHFLKEEPFKGEIVGFIKSPALKRGPYYGKIASTYLFEVEGVKDQGEWRDLLGVSQIRIETEKDYQYGVQLLVTGTIKKPYEAASGEFNYREYLERQNIFALINTKEHNITVLSHDYKSNPILKYTYLLREKLKNQFIEKMPLDSGAFLRAILLGDRSELPKKLQELFKNSGTIHILAISGLHVGLIALIIIYLLKCLKTGRIFSYIFTILFLIFFSLLTLSRPSVTRAVLMAGVFLIGMLLGKRVDVYNSLGIAAIFILARNPKELFNIGFQLSFMAVMSILYLTPKLTRLIKKDTNLYIKRYILIPLSVSISAWLGTAPLILYYFKIVTPVSILANLFILPALFVLLVSGVGFALTCWVPLVGVLFANINNLLAQLIFSLAEFFSSLRFGHFYF